ncbi:YceI family protein [Phenylobacterium sp. LH3H17]|uniref:YceI family protein n=1 Tax=Phenylobacterium sp. LH3H17 TaxID=2903901 RepID=UPI0020C9540F|nr:YceI family protein [Phenylobacterium sp. LH3H17]UTP39051.1 YceI family protein [Phenylobacterium sp. LH3H17]
MVRTLLAAIALGLALVGPAAADPITQDPARVPAGDYALDPRHASLLVQVPHMGGFSKFIIRFEKLTGGFAYDPANWGATQATITVDAASLRTNVPGFDKTLTGSSYLDVGKHPTITFVANRTEGEPAKGVVHGDLTILGVTRPVDLSVVFNGVGPGLLGVGTRLGFSGTARIKRSEFGLTTMSSMAGDDLDLMFEVEFTRK